MRLETTGFLFTDVRLPNSKWLSWDWTSEYILSWDAWTPEIAEQTGDNWEFVSYERSRNGKWLCWLWYTLPLTTGTGVCSEGRPAG